MSDGRDAPLPKQLIGRLSRIDSPTLETDFGRTRLSFEFDALDRETATPLEAVSLDAMAEMVRGVNALRISTTLNRYLQFTGALPAVGDWYLFDLASEKPKGGLAISRAPLSVTGFGELERLYAKSAERISGEEPTSLRLPTQGPTIGSSFRGEVLGLVTESTFPSAAIATAEAISALFDDRRPAWTVSVRDVGQAAYACVRDDAGKVLLYFDVGWPMPFNKRTAPEDFIPDPERAPIALSHWDWDHLQAAFQFKHFLECVWIAPVQKLGPGAVRLATGLHKKGRLFGLQSGAAELPFGMLASCNAPPTNTNDSGLALRVDLPSDFQVLLVGDAAYQHLPTGWQVPVDGLVATHHGALFSGGHTTVPTPKEGRRRVIASFGAGNTYKHPHPDAVHDHRTAGWTTWDTTAGRGHGSARGDRHFPR